jgi:MFS-type transporter involved in bile tolerance (Atg22 family)
VLGFFQVAYYATTNTILQLLVPARLRGRVIALYILTSTGFIPVGNILAGVLAERIGAAATLAGMVSITLLVCALVVLRVPELSALRPEGSVRRGP